MEERLRRTSSDLRYEIVDLGGAENITELRSRKKMKNKEAKSSNLTNVHVVRKFNHVYFKLISYQNVKHLLICIS